MPDGKILFESENPEAVVAVILALSTLRSAHIVGRALAERFPREEDWAEYLDSRAFLELIEEMAQFLQDVRETLKLDDLDPWAIQTAVQQHYTGALDAVQDLAEHLSLDGRDLLTILMA